MTQPIADFRSDTLTRPTPEMREAMARAEVGDDVFQEDPTVRLLEEEAAAFLGKEKALYLPSGTMANQCAIHVHCRPGDELICEERAHVFVYEGGGVARFSGTQVRPLPSERGFPTPAQVRAAVRADDVHYPRSRLLVLENTHNMAGGTVLDLAGMQALAEVAREAGMNVHLDGARLANAAVALDRPVAELASCVDSVSLCLSKGLGAPVGSVLGGQADWIDQARRARKAMGGGMRQAGVIAAAARLALRDGPASLQVDHQRARAMARAFDGLRGMRAAAPDTNIVMLDLDQGTPAPLLAVLRSAGVLALAVAAQRIRFVTHRDLNDTDIDRCVEVVTGWAHSH